ncbi:hypothetical protein D3C85_1754590 [compost metagenome]
MLYTLIIKGRNSTGSLSIRWSLCMSKYVGINPPLNSIVNKNRRMKNLRPLSLGFESG